MDEKNGGSPIAGRSYSNMTGFPLILGENGEIEQHVLA